MNHRVIVLEDDDAIRKLFTLMLEDWGFEVVSASDATLCPLFAALNECCPHEDACGDFLLADNRMPNMTGLELIERQSQRGCKGTVKNKAVFSAAWNQEELDKAEALGCKIFSKPYSFTDVYEWLNERKKNIPYDRKLLALSAGA